MLPFFVEQFGNPHSRTHLYGWQSEEAVELARKRVADLIGADAKEIIFTSVRVAARSPAGAANGSATQGATESNNMAIKGIANFYRDRKRHVITTQTDHKCVLDSCRHLQQAGWDVTYLPVQPNGLVDLQQLEVRREARVRASACAAPDVHARGCGAGSNPRGHRTGVRYGRQQRDWRGAAARTNRRDLPTPQRFLSHGRSASDGQSAA